LTGGEQGYYMYRTKSFIAGMILITLLAGIGCGAGPAQTPVSTPPEIPAGYTTYTDESQLFSISYPADWDMPMSQVPGLQQKARETINDLKTGVAIQNTSVIFIAGLQAAQGYEPNMNIGVEPAPIGINTHDQMVETVLGGFKTLSSGYKEVGRTKTTVDGREATIVSWESSVAGQKNLHFLQMYTMVDNVVWIVTCTATPENFPRWENDFNTIVRSLRIST